jgi:hypothetical protein
MKTIIRKGELLSKLTHVDEEVFKDCLEEIFWEDVDSAFMFDSTSLRIDWKDNIPVRIIVELTDEEYDTANSLTIVTFILTDRNFVSYITGIQKFYDNYFEDKYTTQTIDKDILERILVSYIGSLRKYSDEMDWSMSNESDFFK